ncbi:TRIM2 [Branchiostoma lanceolatum]|uniref:TRIM2 protein n=1 Tax=Branchiostoma lanceolatum TaxID=7740 RepID=A0A8J9YWB6_BRALA|nr:TRIM2 [Branchiostoma lanceolatum]
MGQADILEHQENDEGKTNGVDMSAREKVMEESMEKDLKESSPHHKKGLCKCSRGDVKSVHCSVCQKYVCLHCATHAHKDHSEEEIREALDKEKDKIKNGLDIASTCAEAHKKRLEELSEAEQNLLKQFENMSIKIADHSEIALGMINERVESIIQAVRQEAEKARESVRDFKAVSLEELIVAFEERRGNITEEREAAQVAFAASSSYSNISRKILDDGSSAVVLTSSNSLSEVFKTLKYPCEKTPSQSAIPSDYDRRLWFMAPQVDLNGEIQKWFGKVINNSCKEVAAKETRRPSKSPTTQRGPTLIASLKSATTQLHRTFSVAADDENDIIVGGQNIVRIFNSATMRLKSAVALAFSPEGLAAYGDEIFVTGNGHNIHVLKKSGDSRRVLHVEGVLSRLQGIAVDSTGRIIATEGRQVFVLLSDGTDVCTFDVASEGGPVRLYPATNSSDRIIISDQSGHSIKLYDASGNLIREIGGKGKDDGQLLSPAEVCTDAEDNIIVADTKNNRVSQFNPDGTFDRHLVVEENYVRFPWGVAMTGDGRLVVSSLAVGQAVKVFDLHKNS